MLFPQDKKPAVLRGLREAFGVTDLEDVRQVANGVSSDLVFRIVVRRNPYLLRIMTRSDERIDPGRIFACMNAAAEAGLTPRVLYSNSEDGVAIADFIDSVPFSPRRALIELPGTIRRLHGLPPFPKAFNYLTAHNGFVWRFRNAGLFPNNEVEELFVRYGQVCAAYPRLDSDMVSCHGDLRPENILFDGERVWLVSWQAAFVNDRYFDLAVAANFAVCDDADECIYLARYFGQEADEYQRARFFLMRQVLHMLSATVFLMLGSAGKPIERTENLPSFQHWHQRIWAGEIDLAEDGQKIVYGLVHWRQLQENMRGTRLSEALGIVSERNRGQEGIRLLLPGAPFPTHV